MRSRYLLPLAVVAGCGDGAVAPGTPGIEVVPPGSFNLAAGAAGPTLTARVTSSDGQPLGGVRVDWQAGTGGQVQPAVDTTDAGGLTTTTFSATTPGIIGARASVPGDFVDFTITVTAGPPASVVVSGGSNQNAVAGARLPAPIAVTVRDQFGNLVGGVPVAFSITTGGGDLLPDTVVTNASGVAGTTWVTGPAVGIQTASATAAGAATLAATFTATTVGGIALAARVPVPDNYAIHDQFVRDGLVFVSAWNTGLIIYDVGNGIRGGKPWNPIEVSRILPNDNGVPGGAAVHNAWWFHNPVTNEKRYLFVGQEGPGFVGGSSSGDIHVIDVSNLAAPVEVASFRMAGAGVHNFWMDEPNQILYAAYYNGGVVALDVSGMLAGNLAGREIARVQPGGVGNTYIWGVHLHTNGSLYATDMLSGFWQLQLVGNAFQVLAGGNNVPDRYGSDQWVHGSYAYSGTWGNRGTPGNAVKVWQLGAGGAPTLVDSVITAGIGTVSDVEVSADGLLLMFSAEGGANRGLHFLSLAADPASPAPLATYPVAQGVHTATMATIGSRRYVFAAQDPAGSGLLILDVTSIGP